MKYIFLIGITAAVIGMTAGMLLLTYALLVPKPKFAPALLFCWEACSLRLHVLRLFLQYTGVRAASDIQNMWNEYL